MKKLFLWLAMVIMTFVSLRAATVTVYFEKPDAWKKVWVYDYGNQEHFGGWPGQEIAPNADGVYMTKAYDDATAIIFNKGTGGDKGTDQTEDLPVRAGFTYHVDNSANDVRTGQIKSHPEYVLVHFKNTANWATPHVYVFSNEGGPLAWPGVMLQDCHYANDVYSIYAPKGYSIIFSDGRGSNNGGSQTHNLTIEEGYTYTASTTQSDLDSWGGKTDPDPDVPGDKITLYFRNTSKWPSVYVYTWQGGDKGHGEWPGGQLSEKSYDGTYDVYTVALDKKFASYSIIFNNGNSGNGNQTSDLFVQDGYTYAPNTTVNNGKLETPSVGGDISSVKPTGTLPVMYIICEDDAIRSKDLADKDYRTGASYWIEVPQGSSFKAVGSSDKPETLDIKARGNYTRTGFAKKPYKIKLGSKQKLLGLSKSKHFALLAHADDDCGYLRNFIGFNLGKRMDEELPWTPGMQPVELVINGDYRGLYFLTESIRIEDGRIEIAELDDNVDEPSLVSGGYLVELDNYDDDMQIKLNDNGNSDGLLRITADTPEIWSNTQRSFLTDQFTKMNNLVHNHSNDLWSYLDLDAVAGYYVVMEIIDHWEAFHGSTYLFRDFGNGQKWVFSPLWDCGNAFGRGSNNKSYFTSAPNFGNNWIKDLRENAKFMAKVKAIWQWFWGTQVESLYADIDSYASSIKEAAKRDHQRWGNAPWPSSGDATFVRDNSDMDSKVAYVKNALKSKIDWLTSVWGTPSANAEVPAKDTTPAAALPSQYAPKSPDADAFDACSRSLPVLNINTAGADIVREDYVGATATLMEYGASDWNEIPFNKKNTLQIKGRGTTTWDNFDKKPYRLKFDEKQQFGEIKKSKHWVLLPWEGDREEYSYLRNIAGHAVADVVTPEAWTPRFVPVEVIVNSDYKGLYFLVENIRPAAERVNIEEFGDYTEETLPEKWQNWIVEIDQTADVADVEALCNGTDVKYVASSPEYAEVREQDREWLSQELKAVTAAIEEGDWDNISGLIDVEALARYYIIQEIMDDANSFNTSCYLTHAEGGKWTFGPVWDFIEAFGTATSGSKKSNLIHQQNSSLPLIGKLYSNPHFKNTVIAQYLLLGEKEPKSDIFEAVRKGYVGISDALASNSARWSNPYGIMMVDEPVDPAESVNGIISNNMDYLTTVWNAGGFTGIEDVIVSEDGNTGIEYYDLYGRRISEPNHGQIYISRQGGVAGKILVK